jgi:hypothetical protein
MGRQIGQFFLLIGVLIFVLFALSIYAGQTDAWLFIFGIGLMVLGARLVFKNRKKGEPAERFRMMRRLFKRE